MEQQELVEKIKRLPQDRVAEVESFVDSLARRERSSDRTNLHRALSEYAIQHAGTAADILMKEVPFDNAMLSER